MGIGRASFKVLALLAITDSWSALNRRSSKSGKSIASRAATHFKEVLKAGNTDGSTLSLIKSQCILENLVNMQRMWIQRVNWSPYLISFERSDMNSHGSRSTRKQNHSLQLRQIILRVRSSDWSSKERSLAAAPARLPIASRRAAQRAFSAFSLSSKGVLEGWTGSGFSLLFGAVGLETKALIKASLRSSS